MRLELDKNNNQLVIITSDRLSSFNRVLTTIPLKGVLLNKISTWWFNKTEHIVPNHLIQSYHRTMIVKKTKVFPIEFIMRGYLTGTTNTSIWYNYSNGVRNYCGHILEDGLKKVYESIFEKKFIFIKQPKLKKSKTDKLIEDQFLKIKTKIEKVKFAHLSNDTRPKVGLLEKRFQK